MKHYTLPLITFVMCLMLALPCAALAEEADTYGAPALKLGESGTEEGYSERITVFEDKLDSKTKLWNKVNNPVVAGNEYTVALIEGVTVAKDPDGNILYEGNDVGAAVNKAIKALDGRKGTVLIEDGEYEVMTTIRMANHITLWGINRPLLKNVGASPVILLPPYTCYTTISNLIIDGKSAILSGTGIEARDFTCYNTFTDVYVCNVEGDGISFRGSSSQNNVLQRCKVTDTQVAGIGFYASAGGSLVQDCYVLRTRFHTIIVSTGGGNMRIIDNTVVESGYYTDPELTQFCHGIALDGYGKVHGHNNLVKGNMIKDTGMAGIEVADYQDDVVVTGNVIDGTGTFSTLDCYGIYFGGGLTESVNAIITNNTVMNTRGPGIRVNAPLDHPFTENVLIANNDISNAGQDGILIQKANHVVINHNRILNSGAVIKNSNGIAIKGLEDLASDIIITDNIATDTRKKQRQEFGLFVLNGNNVMVSGNDFSGNGEDDWFELNNIKLMIEGELISEY